MYTHTHTYSFYSLTIYPTTYSVYVYMYICVYICMCVCISLYIYIFEVILGKNDFIISLQFLSSSLSSHQSSLSPSSGLSSSTSHAVSPICISTAVWHNHQINWPSLNAHCVPIQEELKGALSQGRRTASPLSCGKKKSFPLVIFTKSGIAITEAGQSHNCRGNFHARKGGMN